MGRSKRENQDDTNHAEKRRRGKARQGGDVSTLLHQHDLRALRVQDMPWSVQQPDQYATAGYEGDAPAVKDLATYMISSVHLPQASQLLHVAWVPRLSPWSASPGDHECSYPLQATPLHFSVASHEHEESVSIQPYESARLTDPAHPSRPIYLLDAVGHVYDLAWAPFVDTDWLVVACTKTRGKGDDEGMLQFWKHTNDVNMAFTIKLDDTPLRVGWRPGVPAPSTLGTLAVSMKKGHVLVLDIPCTEAKCIQLTPRMILQVPGTSCFSVAWGGDARLASGCTNGHIAVWDVDASEKPLVDAPVHDTLVSAVSWQMLPPFSTSGSPDLAARPQILLSVGWDGSEHVTDVLDVYATARFAHSREPRYAAVWAPWNGAWIVDMGDHQFGTVSLRTHDVGKHHVVGFHHGRILALDASAFHPFIASGSADGSVHISNALQVSKRKAIEPGGRLMHKRFRLVRRDDSSFSLRHGYYPEGILPTAQGLKQAVFSVDRWDPAVGVTSVAWCPNASRALWLASGTGIGLVRIECVES